ncbi:MAG: ParB/RepB/Spo0J family partition protein [Acidobacteriota bacterium]
MLLQTIKIDKIDAGDRIFAIRFPWLSKAALLVSIRNAGILSPLQLQRKPGGFRIVNGFRRYEAARELEIQDLPAIIREGESERELFLQALFENLTTRALHPLEKAVALQQLKNRFGFEQEQLIEEFLPLLEIRPDRFHLQQYLEIARLPESIQRRLAESLELEIALKLAAWGGEEQALILDRISRYQLGRNRQKELFALLDELRGPSGNRRSVPEIWSTDGISEIENDDRLPAPEQFQKILDYLRRLRYPTLGRYEERFSRLKSDLKIPPEIHFQAPRFFEGDRLSVSFSFQTPQELGRAADKLKEISGRPELVEIFKLL